MEGARIRLDETGDVVDVFAVLRTGEEHSYGAPAPGVAGANIAYFVMEMKSFLFALAAGPDWPEALRGVQASQDPEVKRTIWELTMGCAELWNSGAEMALRRRDARKSVQKAGEEASRAGIRPDAASSILREAMAAAEVEAVLGS